MMGLEEGTETCPVFPALQKALEDSLHLPIYINSAVMEFAMAGLHYNEIHAKAENQVFLYWDSGSYHAIPINGNTPLLAAAAGDAFIERLCVDPDGRAMEGYPGAASGQSFPQRLWQTKSARSSPKRTPRHCLRR